MKITDFKTYVFPTPWRNLTYLVLETDQNIRGVGEARVVAKTHTVLEHLKHMRSRIVGHEVYDVEDLYRRFTVLDYGDPGEVTMTALALVEMACWDLIGKKAGLPVCQLLGGTVHEKILAYANGWYTVEREPEAFAAAAQRVIERGYRAMKFDPFGAGHLELTPREFRRSIELAGAVHAAVPADTQLFIEMHGRFAPHQAVQVAKALEPLNPAWIEEPCRPDDLGALDYVQAHTCIPIATGERLYKLSSFRELFERRSAQIIQPDISQAGGILEGKKIASAAEMWSMMVAPHNVGGIITTAATLQLMATLRNGKVLEHFNDFVDSQVKSLGTGYPEVVDGYFHVPTSKPGLGVEMDFDALESGQAETVDGVIQDRGLNLFVDEQWHQRSQEGK